MVYGRCLELHSKVDAAFEVHFSNPWLRAQNENYRIEAKSLASYCATKGYPIESFADMAFYLDEYYHLLKAKGYRAERSRKLLLEFLNGGMEQQKKCA